MATTMTILTMAVLCLLPVISMAARPVAHTPCVVKGRVYCDPCRAGFETPASIYIQGAKVKLECRDRHTQELLYKDEAITDKTGTYNMHVKEDQKNRVCDTMLVSSPHKTCSSPDIGRERSRVVLTNNNGLTSSERIANNMGFLMEQPMSFCPQLLKQYELDEQTRF